MKYFYYFIILLISSSVMATGITIPKITQDMHLLASKTIKVRQQARLTAINSKPHIISTKTIARLKTIKPNIAANQQSVSKLLEQTIQNNNWQQKQNKLTQNLYQKLDINQPTQQGRSGYRLYLFISSSIPKDKLRNYTRQLASIPNAQIIMRGFIGGAKKMTPTMHYLRTLINKDKNCIGVNCPTHKVAINIDPILFNRYQISKVPALVYVDSLTGANWCSEGNTKLTTASGVHKFTGLAPLKYMLRELVDASNNDNLLKIYKDRYEQ